MKAAHKKQQKRRVPRANLDFRQVEVIESEYLDDELDEPDYLDDRDKKK
jgi:hypothetical protein